MGASGCGKSTLEKALNESESVYKTVSVTTREMRINEVDGVDYHFISDEEFNLLDSENKLIQKTSFCGVKYGTTYCEYETDHEFTTLVAVPESACKFIPVLQERYPDYKIRTIFFDITTARLISNMLLRGDTEHMIAERLASDDIAQQWLDADPPIEYDILVNNSMLNPSLSKYIKNELNIA